MFFIHVIYLFIICAKYLAKFLLGGQKAKLLIFDFIAFFNNFGHQQNRVKEVPKAYDF